MKKKIQLTPKEILSWGILLTLLGLASWGLRWASYARPPLPEAMEALESDDLVVVTKEPWLTFSPTKSTQKSGFIFYPGGRIDTRAYSSLMKTIASDGYLVVVPEMPMNMVVFNSDIADEIIADYPEIDHWVMGGHSVGGVAAAQYTDKNPEVIDGLAIWASYPADSTNISGLDIPVLLIYGSLEERVNDTSVGERKHLLPKDTLYIRIDGGDHHQFGSYVIKPEEHLATTSRASQHEQIIQATLDIISTASQ